MKFSKLAKFVHFVVVVCDVWGRQEGICISPLKMGLGPKKVHEQRFRASVCVFLTLASQKYVYVPERKHRGVKTDIEISDSTLLFGVCLFAHILCTFGFWE